MILNYRYSQQFTDPKHEPFKHSPNCPTLFIEISSTITLQFTPTTSKWHVSSRHFHQKTYTYICTVSLGTHPLPTLTSLHCSSSFYLERSTNHATPHYAISPGSVFPFPPRYKYFLQYLPDWETEFTVFCVLLNDSIAFEREKCSFYDKPSQILWNLLMVLFAQLSQSTCKLEGEKKSIQSDDCYSHCSLPTSSLFGWARSPRPSFELVITAVVMTFDSRNERC